jgi:riboflavin transporter FmnP
VEKLNTKTIALIIVFTAIAIALNPVVIPVVFAPGFFRFWEIPIVVAFLLLGPKSGVTVAVLRTLAELTLFPGPAGILGPPIVLIATLGMLLGLYIATRILKHKHFQGKNLGKKPVMYFTVLGTFFRVSISPFTTYILYRFALPLFGIRVPQSAIMGLIPVLMLVALILALYTIPIGYLLARIVSRNLKVGNQL